VASWFGRNTGDFREGASETVRGGSVSVHGGAGRGWHCVGRSMWCVCACSAELDGVQVHGNERHALRALGGSLTSGWHGRGALHGRARAELAWGIDPGGRRRAGGEVIARGMVGAMLSVLGTHGGRGGVLGERGVPGQQ
jgi:hypothetical protein